jgi:hypothetical protein
MAHEAANENWGDVTARKTFVMTMIGAALFIGAVIVLLYI